MSYSSTDTTEGRHTYLWVQQTQEWQHLIFRTWEELRKVIV